MRIQSLSVFRSITYSLAVCIAFLTQPLWSQDKLLMIRQHKQDGFGFYDLNGKLLFSTPPGHEPCLHHPLEPFTCRNFEILDNTSKVLPINSREGLYLISTVTGKTITKFDQSVTYMPPPENGYLRAHVKYLDQKRQSTISYYDLTGKKVFGNGIYWEGSKVIDGMAIVQILQPGVETYNQDGDWLLIDAKGNTIKNISKETGEKFYSVAEDQNNEWKLSVKGKSAQYRYVKPPGEIGPTSLIPPAMRDPLVAKTARYADSLAMRDRSGSGEWMLYPKSYFGDKGFFLTVRYDQITFQNLPRLKDYKSNPIPLTVEGRTAHPLKFVNPHYVLTVVLEQNTPLSFPLFDLRTMQVTADLEREPNRFTEELIIFFSSDASESGTPEKILNMQGKLIYESPAGLRYFGSITEALKYRTTARRLRLKNTTAESLEGIDQLLNLEILELENYQGETFPEGVFNTLKNVKVLRLHKCNNLTSLPEAFKQFSGLQHLSIIDCKSVVTVVDFFKHWPVLETFKTDLSFSREIAAKYPKIKVEELPVLMEVTD